MTKQDAVFCYKTAMSIFQKWLEIGAITEKELLTIDTIIAEKYGLSLSSIYLENDLLYNKNRVNIGINL